MKIFKSSWRIEAICNNCKSNNIGGKYQRFCRNCGELGKTLVLMRKIRRFPYLAVEKEYKNYGNFVNPME